MPSRLWAMWPMIFLKAVFMSLSSRCRHVVAPLVYSLHFFIMCSYQGRTQSLAQGVLTVGIVGARSNPWISPQGELNFSARFAMTIIAPSGPR